MKILFSLILFNTIGICVFAQSSHATLSPLFYLPNSIHVTVYMMDKHSITGQLWKFSDSNLMMYGRNNSGIIEFKNISCKEMRSLKIRRNDISKAIINSAITGAFIGYDNNSYPHEKNALVSPDALKGATVGAMYGAGVGYVIAGVIPKKNFKINGSNRKFQKVFKTLRRIDDKQKK